METFIFTLIETVKSRHMRQKIFIETLRQRQYRQRQNLSRQSRLRLRHIETIETETKI